MLVIYIVCAFIEIKLLKRNKISILYKENLLLVFIMPVTFPLAIFTLFFFCNAIKDICWTDNNDILMSGYYFTFIFASLAYIIAYIKNKIYAFIPNKNKLSIFGIKTIYDKEDKYY